MGNTCAAPLGGPHGWVVTCVTVPVSQALRENTYPFLAVIMLKDRRMTVVGRLEGLIQADDLINQLMFIMDANQTYLVSERLERWGGTSTNTDIVEAGSALSPSSPQTPCVGKELSTSRSVTQPTGSPLTRGIISP